MKHGDWKRRCVQLSVAAVLITVILYCLLWSRFSSAGTWSPDEFRTGSRPVSEGSNDPGTSVQSSTDLKNFSILLHPEEHTQREARRIELRWNISTGMRRPDGVSKRVFLVNGEFPGPTVEVRSGDHLVVKVRNQLVEEDVAIHWHGLRIANEMDGVVGLTQCGVSPGKEMEYELSVPNDQSGSFWWHSHSEIQRADGLFGALIVHKPDAEDESRSEKAMYGYDEEQVLMIGDWYHRPAEQVLSSYTDWKNFKIEPAPDSLLLNGKGYFNCSMALKARPLDCETARVPTFPLPQRTRMRIVNTGALTGISLATSGYTMAIVQVDGGHGVKEVTSRIIGVLYPGERVDVVFERHDDGPARIEISIDRENMGFPNLALTAQQQFPIVHQTMNGIKSHGGAVSNRSRPEPIAERIDLARLVGANVRDGLLTGETDQTILLYATISYMTRYEYRPKGFFNHTFWSPASFGQTPLASIDRAQWPKDPPMIIPEVKLGDTVDLVINNLDDKGHPLHLHGHDFYVVARHQPSRMGAFEQYNPFEDMKPPGDPMDLESPLMKDTVYVPSMGYVVLRVQVDNPGLWLLHCHVLWHAAVGMNMAMEVADGPGPVFDASARERVASVCRA